MTDQIATLSRADGYVEARFSRITDQDSARVWAMITESANLPLWLAPGEIDLREGGAAKINFTDSGVVIDSTVTAFDRGHLLEYSWSAPGQPQRPVRWQLLSTPQGTIILLTIRTPEGEDAARAAAGWEAHLDMLEAALAGVPIKFPFERFKSAREAYREQLSR